MLAAIRPLGLEILMPHRPRTAHRRITGATISMISLVPRGANQLPVLYKSDDQTAQFDTLIKDDLLEEQGLLTAVVYSPEQTDSQGDIASAEVIKDMAHDFAKRGLGSIDVRHDGKAVGEDAAFVAESFIVQKNDDRFSDIKDYSGNSVDVTGSWAVVIKVQDEELKSLYRQGKWNGVSMFGNATVKAASEEGLPSQIIKALGTMLGLTKPDNGDIDMESKELEAILAKQHKTTMTAVAELISKSPHDATLLKEAGVEDGDTPEVINLKVELHKAKDGTPGNSQKPGTKKVDADKPKFKGDPTDEKAVKAFDFDVKKYEILSKMDATDPASVAEANKELTELAKTEGDNSDEGKSDREVALETELAKIRKNSNQPAPGKDGKPRSKISKEDAEALEIAKETAAWANGDTKTLRELNLVA